MSTPPSSPPSTVLSRRAALRGAALAAAVPALSACGGGNGNGGPGLWPGAQAQGTPQTPAGVSHALAAFAQRVPQGSSALVVADTPQGSWSASHQPQQRVFIGSAFKIFVLGQALIDGERGRLDLAADCAIDDTWRTSGSPVFERLSGTSDNTKVLEAMIAHSDNTATDIALNLCGVQRVRALIASSGLTQTQIPDSARRLLSYLVGAPLGTDIGWAGLRDGIPDDWQMRPTVVNPDQSIQSTAEDLVHWYRQSLAGRLFVQPATLREYKRIAALAGRLIETAPADAVYWGKPGWLDWMGFHALCLAGQVRVNHVPISFSFTWNWHGGSQTSEDRFEEFTTAMAQVLGEAARAIEGASCAGGRS